MNANHLSKGKKEEFNETFEHVFIIFWQIRKKESIEFWQPKVDGT